MKTTTERVDNIPLLIAEFEKSDLSNLLGQYFPNHGNWQGIKGGKVAVLFLTYILSCNDHRLSHVEQWAADRINTLRYGMNEPALSSKDLTDDKLGALLDNFSDMEQWSLFEHAHNRKLINVYNLNTDSEAIRLDAMITQSHRAAEGDFQYGYAKQHRSDLPQLKTMVATLDPMAMPLYSLTVSGNTADDVLYWPVIESLINNLPLRNQLFVGDSKMGSIETRAKIHAKDHYYLVPLSKKQCSPEQLATYVQAQPAQLEILERTNKDGSKKIKAKAFEVTELIELEGTGFPWSERRIIVYSPAYAKRQQIALEDRLIKAQTALTLLLESKQGRKKIKTREELQLSIKQVLSKHKCQHLLSVEIKEEVQTKKVRAYLDKPERIDTFTHFNLIIEVNEQEKKKQLDQLGWRAYATNAPVERLSLIQAVECYRNEYKIEHKFDELLNKITVLMPVLLHKPNRIKALICLLLLALKYVSLLQYQVREELANTKQKLKELYPGNPGRATDKPTTNMLLKAFENTTLVIASVENKIYVHLRGLKPIQLKILELLKMPSETYLGLNELVFSSYDFGET